jgi:hypothetical protein
MTYRTQASVWHVTGLYLAACMLAAPAAFAQFTYIDVANPTGLPDLTQRREPICGAAAFANTFWNWSAFPPFNAATHPLAAHTNRYNFAVNWGSDSDVLVQGLAVRMYGARQGNTRAGGPGLHVGAMRQARDNAQAYNEDTYPNGLSLHWTGLFRNIKYSALQTLVAAANENAVLEVKGFQANSLFVEHCPGISLGHALTVTGLNPTLSRLLVSNPWGNHAAPGDPNPPVTTGYYDGHAIDTTDDLIRFPRNGIGNAALVARFDVGPGPPTATAATATPTPTFTPAATGTAPTPARTCTPVPNQTAASVRAIGIYRVKRGGSPHVTATITDAAASQSLRYRVVNPDSSDPIYHVYILLDPAAIDVVQAYLAAGSWLLSNQPDWEVEILDPNAGPEARIFDATRTSDPAVIPEYTLDDWSSAATGLHFSTSTAPVASGRRRQ